MKIINWRPFDIETVFDLHAHEIGDLAVDMYDEHDGIVVEMALAGIDPDKVDISVEDTSLRVSGEREETAVEEDKNYYKREIKRGSFERYLSLPTTVVPEETKASFEDGILKIFLPKKKAAKTSKVKVKRSES
jgi:HSP20 family protein